MKIRLSQKELERILGDYASRLAITASSAPPFAMQMGSPDDKVKISGNADDGSLVVEMNVELLPPYVQPQIGGCMPPMPSGRPWRPVVVPDQEP